MPLEHALAHAHTPPVPITTLWTDPLNHSFIYTHRCLDAGVENAEEGRKLEDIQSTVRTRFFYTDPMTMRVREKVTCITKYNGAR